MWNSHENSKHRIAPRKNALNTRYSSQPLGYLNDIATCGRTNTAHIVTRNRINPTRCVHIFPVSVCNLQNQKFLSNSIGGVAKWERYSATILQGKT